MIMNIRFKYNPQTHTAIVIKELLKPPEVSFRNTHTAQTPFKTIAVPFFKEVDDIAHL